MTPDSAVHERPGHPGHLLLDERADDRRRAVARGRGRSPPRGTPPGRPESPSHAADVEVLVEDRDRRVEQAARPPRRARPCRRPRRAGGAARPGRRRRGRRAAPPATAADEAGDDRAPGRARAQDHGGNAQVGLRRRPADHRHAARRAAGRAARRGTPAGRRSPRGRRRRRSPRPRPGWSSDAPLGIRRAPSSARDAGQIGEMSARPGGGARGPRLRRHRAPQWGGPAAGFKRPVRAGPVVCPPGETSRAPFGPSVTKRPCSAGVVSSGAA